MLINTKLCVPPLKARMLHRKHLADRLSIGRDCRLISVSGPAASGKTSLVCEWIKREGLTVAWYSLDEADNDHETFFQYLLAALSRAGGLPLSVIGYTSQGPHKASTRDIISHLAAQLRDLKEDLYLVLDDYHLISVQEIHNALSLLITHMPARMHLVVLSRYDLPFPLSRWKIRNEMLEISSQDMKWSPRETDRFFREVLGIHLSPGQSEQLTRHMEGWVGGLQLFALSLKGKRTMASMTPVLGKACQDAAEYLINEVINTQPGKVHLFLLKTALLDRFNAEVCGAVTGMEDAGEILGYVFQKNLFLNSLNDEETWFRYHHLFSKAVRKRARMISEEMCREVYRTAALWYAKNGYLEDAFRHAFASEDSEFAADVLEDYLGILYDRDEIAAFRRWLLKLPRDVFFRHPLLRLLECRFKIETVQLSDIAETLKDIEDCRAETLSRYEGPKRQPCDDLLLLFKYILPHWYDPEHVDVEKLKDALDRVSPNSRTLAGIGMLIPFKHFYRGEMVAADEALDETASVVFSSGRRLDRAIWFRVKAMVERFQGRLSGSEAVLDEALPCIKDDGIESGDPLEFMINLPRAWLFYLRNDIGKAMEHGSAALKYVEQSRFLYELIDGNYLMALIHLARRDTEKASRCVQRMQWGARAAGAPELLSLTDAYLARITLCKGDFASLERWAFQHAFREDDPFSLRFVTRSLVLSEIMLRRGDYGDASHVLTILRDRCAEHHMLEAVLEADILLAVCAFATKDRRRARTLMKRALTFAESEGYVRPFVERADLISSLLFEVAGRLSRNGEAVHAATVAKACALSLTGDASGRQTGRVGEDLTRREKETLGLMAKGLRDKEIAESLFVSLPTIKTHVRHVLEKLDARTRVQAIQRAREEKISLS
jgi:LuxR family transcriptional regulator, maltose regulon positive regulatory protein